MKSDIEEAFVAKMLGLNPSSEAVTTSMPRRDLTLHDFLKSVPDFLQLVPSFQNRLTKAIRLEKQLAQLQHEYDMISKNAQWFKSFNEQSAAQGISLLREKIASLDTQISDMDKQIASKKNELNNIKGEQQ